LKKYLGGGTVYAFDLKSNELKARVGSNPIPGTHYRSLTYKEKQIMEILSFILGISLVVVIAIAIVTIYAFVKVGKLANDVRDFDSRESAIYQNMQLEVGALHRRVDELDNNLNRRVDDFEKDIYSQLDSRLDKLENKLTGNLAAKQIIKG
jgi:hypothetical protein